MERMALIGEKERIWKDIVEAYWKELPRSRLDVLRKDSET
jgi:hypothetical protein